jgi:hypothetical protein
MRWQVVHDDDIAATEGRCEALLDVRQENGTIHRAIATIALSNLVHAEGAAEPDRNVVSSEVSGPAFRAQTDLRILADLKKRPTFFVQEGLSITKSFGYTLVIITGSPIGCAIGAFSCDYFGRKPSLIAAAVAPSL